MKPPIQAVLLDMGGVLLDVGSSDGLPTGLPDYRGRQALLEVLGVGRSLTLEDLDSLLFQPWRRTYRQRYKRGRDASWEPHLARLRDRVGSAASDLDLLRAWFEPYAESLTEMEGAAAALEKLFASGLRLALVSNVPAPGELYLAVMERLGLAGVFESLQFSYDCGHRKPSPYMIRRALTDLEIEPRAAVMVGDRCSMDVAAGRSAGVGTVWLRSEFVEGPRPDWSLESIGDLPDLIASLNAEGST